MTTVVKMVVKRVENIEEIRKLRVKLVHSVMLMLTQLGEFYGSDKVYQEAIFS